MKILILAGGSGTRLWPASRKHRPKQLLPFINNQTLLQNTFNRFDEFVKPSEIFIGTMEKYSEVIHTQLPAIPIQNYSLEPVLRDRGPAIGLATLIIDTLCGDSVFTTAWSDHHIVEKDEYLSILKQAEAVLVNEPNQIITVGVEPTEPSQGLGYIKKSKQIKNTLASQKMFEVDAFQEKPNEVDAKTYFESGEYLWNTGYFIMTSSYLLDLYKQFQPEIYSLLMEIKPSIGTPKQQEVINKIYPLMPKVDFEKGIIEKLENLSVIQATFHWADIGNWKTLKQVLSPDQNLSLGKWVDHDSQDSIVYNYSDQLVATVGLKDLVVVVNGDTILVADKHRAEEVKKLTEKISDDSDLEKHL